MSRELKHELGYYICWSLTCSKHHGGKADAERRYCLSWHMEDYRYMKATLLYQDEVHNEMVQTAVPMSAGHAQVHLPLTPITCPCFCIYMLKQIPRFAGTLLSYILYNWK